MKRTHWLSLAIVVVLTLAVIAPAYGQDGSPATSLGEAGRAPAEGGVTLSPAPDCAGGLQNDGGTFENGYSFYSGAGITSAYFAEYYALPETPFKLTQFCVCLVSLGSPTKAFDMVVFADDGGQPGSELGRVSANATGIPGALPGAWYAVPAAVQVTTSGIWIGFNFNAVTEPSVFLCSDENGPGGAIAGLTSTDGGATWVGLTTYWPGGKAMAIRAEGEVFVPDDEEPLVPVPGPDMVPIPETAVVGSVLADTPAYYAPQADAQTGITIAAGKTLWVYGVDASGTFYKVMLSGQFFWLPTSVMGPNYDEVWQGRPLPTEVVE